jgi:hypothetical protein
MEYVIHTIQCNIPDVHSVYVGSSKNFTQRKSDHKFRSKNVTNTNKLYTAIRKHEGFEDWSMEAIEYCICETQFEASKRERCFCAELKADLNMIRAQSSREEQRLHSNEYQKV